MLITEVKWFGWREWWSDRSACRTIHGAIVEEVDSLAELVDCVDVPNALEDRPILKELARRRSLVLGIGWCPGPNRIANGGLYAQYEQFQ